MSDTYFPENHRKDLEKILSDCQCDHELRSLIESVMGEPVLALTREMELYETLGSVESREELIEGFWTLAIPVAWRYRNLGVPLLDLIHAGKRSVVLAAYAFPYKKGKTFYSTAHKEVERGILDRLDQCGVEQVPPQEVQQLFLDGDLDSANEILKLLSTMERSLIESKFGPFEDNSDFVGSAICTACGKEIENRETGSYPHWVFQVQTCTCKTPVPLSRSAAASKSLKVLEESSYFNEQLAIAVRKLRRRKN